MTSFSSKEISNPLRFGEQLKNQREHLGFSLNYVSRKISISTKYLAALESGSFGDLPGEVYAKNFIKVYSKFLQLDSKDFLSQYSSEQRIYDKTRKDKGGDFKTPVARVPKLYLLVTPKILRGLIILLLAISVLGYLGFKLKAIVTPPELTVESPSGNIEIKNNYIDVMGFTEPEAILKINGQQVITDEQGQFFESIDLLDGVNIIEITAEKRHGQQQKIYRQVIVDQTETTTQTNTGADQEGQAN